MSYTLEGKTFTSRAELARHYGVKTKTLESRLRRGATLRQAVDLDPPDQKDHKAYNLWLKRTGKGQRVCSRCHLQKSLDEFYEKKSGTGTHYSQCKPCVKDQVLESHRRREYGLDTNAWESLFNSQGRVCAICGTDDPQGVWHTDHCHITDETRGILCKHCNLGLGYFRDDESSLRSALQYLQQHSSP